MSSPPAGTIKRDYVRENRKAIRELEDDVRSQRAFTDEIMRMDEVKTKWKMNRFQDIESKMTAIMVRREYGNKGRRKRLC